MGATLLGFLRIHMGLLLFAFYEVNTFTLRFQGRE
jgi:hypothetical protein